ncbi:MAG: hypothetical protein EOR22_23575 [Mesorhizobium sp.]|nr:MAG: hypothetical protein EOR22_23575 [Mesorhizobium sp.]
MGMTKKHWSINALATEFGLDRRTVALRVGEITPAAKENGHPVWYLADVAPVLADKEPPKARKIPMPPGFHALEAMHSLRHPVDKAACLMAMAMVYRVGCLAAALAVGCGASCRVAYALNSAMTIGLMQAATDIGLQAGLEPWVSNSDPQIYEMDAFDQVDWPALAGMAGEVVDLDAWESYSRHQLNPGEDEDAEPAPSPCNRKGKSK